MYKKLKYRSSCNSGSSWGSSLILLCVCLMTAPLCFRVQQWAMVLSTQLRDLTTKYSGSLLLQKVSLILLLLFWDRGREVLA